jgi:hypothetical protein
MNMKAWKRCAALVAAGGMALALVAQFSASGVRTHYVTLAALFVGCAAALHYGLPRAAGRDVAAALLWGAGLSLAYLFGVAFRAETDTLLPTVHWAQLLLRFAGMTLCFGTGLLCFLRQRPGDVSIGSAAHRRMWFFAGWGVLALCWLPWWLYFNPCVVSGDTLVQYRQTLTGTYSNAHPVLHTLSLGFAVRVARWLGMGEAQGFAGYALVQLAGLSAVLAALAARVRGMCRRPWLAAASLAYFAFNPLHATFAITLWKDIPFSALVVVLSLQMLRVAETRGACLSDKRFFMGLVTITGLLPFVRSNGILVTLAVWVTLGLYARAQRVRALATGGGVLAFFLLVQGPVLGALGIAQPDITEALAVPLQQVGYAVSHGDALTAQEWATLEKVIPVEALAQAYDPTTSNAIKFHPEFRQTALRADLPAYARLWLNLGLRYPAAYAQGWGLLTYRYWYPDQSVLFSPNHNYSLGTWSDFVRTRPLIPQFAFLLKLDPARLSTDYPALSPLFSEGMLIWCLLAALACLLARHMGRYALALLPTLAIWLSLMLGAPLAEPRYVYPLYCAMPLFLGLMAMSKRRAN